MININALSILLMVGAVLCIAVAILVLCIYLVWSHIMEYRKELRERTDTSKDNQVLSTPRLKYVLATDADKEYTKMLKDLLICTLPCTIATIHSMDRSDYI